MTRHALTGGAIAVVVGFVLLLGLPESVDENGPVDDATTGTTETTASSFSAQMVHRGHLARPAPRSNSGQPAFS